MKIQGVEIFSAGTWNEDVYTVDDLHEMVRAFNENSSGARPRMKLGHDPKQKVAKELLKSDGQPAVGWIEKLYVKGEKLVADFADIHEKVFSAIQKKAYRKVSSEIFHNIKIGEKTYKKMLAAVALLGADTPGVLNLEDIMSSYSKFDASYEKLAVNETGFETDPEIKKEKTNMPPEKTEAEIKLEFSLQQKEKALEDANAKAEALEKEKQDSEKEIADLKEFKAKAEKEKQELLVAAEVARVDKFTSELVNDKLCTPAMKPLITELLGPEKKEYSMKVADKEVKASKEEILKEALKLFKAAKDVNFDESSSNGDNGSKNKEAELDKKAKEYQAKNKVSYGQAMKAVMRENC